MRKDRTPLSKIHKPPIRLRKQLNEEEVNPILYPYFAAYLQEKLKQKKLRTQKLEEAIHHLRDGRKARNALFCLEALYIVILGVFLWKIASQIW